MKMQNSVILVKKNLKINIRKIKNIIKLETIVMTRIHRRAAYSICNLKYNEPKNIYIVFIMDLIMIIIL